MFVALHGGWGEDGRLQAALEKPALAHQLIDLEGDPQLDDAGQGLPRLRGDPVGRGRGARSAGPAARLRDRGPHDILAPRGADILGLAPTVLGDKTLSALHIYQTHPWLYHQDLYEPWLFVYY